MSFLFLSSPQVLMLVVVSGLVWLTSSFIQGRVYRDTDAPNIVMSWFYLNTKWTCKHDQSQFHPSKQNNKKYTKEHKQDTAP